ncbi:MAG: ABC transporter ATP-binding protein [Bacilli bacterium]|nr:ABC transporter ATP-binding protein [Bacilli bacterium]
MYLELNKVKKTYTMGDITITAADKVSFNIEKGELAVVLGPSGAGKTTVLNILGGMDKCDSGTIIFDGKDISKYSNHELTKYRRNDIGFVFQFYNLVQNLTTLENIELTNQICKDSLSAKDVLISVGLKDRMDNFPSQLSGGEQQRVAIARALAKKPKLLLCDEPTGALDSKTGHKVLEVLQKTCKEYGMTVVIITHNSAIAGIADRIIKMKNGTVEEIIVNEKPLEIKEINW